MRSRVLFVLLAAAVSVSAQVRTVSRVAIVAKPKVYNGPCPAEIQFIGTIFVTHYPVNVTYQWERSDHALGPRRTITIRASGEGVYDTWRLGAAHQHLTVWERVHVLAPTGIRSPVGSATVNCR